MNWVLIGVLAILLMNMMRGYRKGLLRVAYSMVAWIAVLVFVKWAVPYIDTFLVEEVGFEKKITALSFFIALIGGCMIVRFISRMLGIVSKVPVLKGINRLLGLLFGGVCGLIKVWIVFAILALCQTGERCAVLIAYIYQSNFLKTLYENNVLFNGMMK